MSNKILIPILLLASSAAAQTCPAPKPPAASAAAATVAGARVPLSAVDARITDELCQARMEHAAKLAEMRADAADQLVDERVLELEAKARKLGNIEALVRSVIDPVTAPTDAESKAFFEQNEARLEGKGYDEVKADIVGYLTQQRQQTAVAKLLTELRKKYKARVTLPAFRVEVPPGGVSRGPAKAPIHIVEFADYECGYCARALPTLTALKAKYGDQIRWTFRDFPLDFHARAVPAAVAARCAGKQGKYWAMHDTLFANMRALADADLKGHAETLGLDAEAFARCQADPAIAAAVQTDLEVGRRLGINGTPAFFINGQRLTGAQPLEAFAEIIDRELSKP